jgi:hypothetical protein
LDGGPTIALICEGGIPYAPLYYVRRTCGTAIALHRICEFVTLTVLKVCLDHIDFDVSKRCKYLISEIPIYLESAS